MHVTTNIIELESASRLGMNLSTVEEFQSAKKRLMGFARQRAARCRLDAATCDDLVQEALIAVWRNQANINPDKIEAYATTVVRYQSLIHERYWKRTEVMPSVEHLLRHSEPTESRPEFTEVMNESLRQTPSGLRRSIAILFFEHGHKAETIAQVLSMKPATVRSHIFRFKAAIGECMREPVA